MKDCQLWWPKLYNYLQIAMKFDHAILSNFVTFAGSQDSAETQFIV